MSRGTNAVSLALVVGLMACADDDGSTAQSFDPDDADVIEVDRFSVDAGGMFVRDENPALPGPGEAIDFDAMFHTQGFGPAGEVASYYNLDFAAREAQDAYFLVDADGQEFEGQLPIVTRVPGEEGYSDFWRRVEVTVPSDYVVNSIVSEQDVLDSGHESFASAIGYNRALVPAGSTAVNAAGLGETERAWLGGDVVHYLAFGEDEITLSGQDVRYIAIYVCFNINPGEDGGGPPSGPCTEMDNPAQTHNVMAALPGQDGYSPLWSARVYDNASFDDVVDLESAMAAPEIAVPGFVNCPVSVP